MTQDFTFDPAVVPQVQERFDELAVELEAVRWAVLRQASDVDMACGEFRSSVEDATDAFHMSWRAATTTCATSAALVSRNTGVFGDEVLLLDGDLATSVDIGGE